MREYSKVDLLRFAKFAKENEGLKPMELLKAYDIKYPELSSKEKLINLAKGLRVEGLYKALTGENLPIEETRHEATKNLSCALCGYFCDNDHHYNNWFDTTKPCDGKN
jgi:hypothetical protein